MAGVWGKVKGKISFVIEALSVRERRRRGKTTFYFPFYLQVRLIIDTGELLGPKRPGHRS